MPKTDGKNAPTPPKVPAATAAEKKEEKAEPENEAASPSQVEATAAAEKKELRRKNFALLQLKLDKNAKDYGLLAQCLEESGGARDAWLELPTETIHHCIAKATTNKGQRKFTSVLIELLDRATRRSQHQAAAPPSPPSPPAPQPKSISEAYRLLRGDALVAFLSSPECDRLREEEHETARANHPNGGDRALN